MFVAMNKEGSAIFHGLTPERNSLFMRYPIWILVNELKQEKFFQLQIYRDDSIVSEVLKYGIEIKMEPIEKVLEFLRKEN